MTRQEIFDKLSEPEVTTTQPNGRRRTKSPGLEFFKEIFFNEDFKTNDCKVVYDQNYGDGNEWTVVLHFNKANLDVKLEGYYSSYGDSDFSSVSAAVPYQHTETRYRAVEIADIRDMKIDEVTKVEDEN